MNKQKKSEQGQVLILLTAGLITLLAFAALAIDGGRLYSEKRTIQGIADTGALTGGLYIGKHTPAEINTTVLTEALNAATTRINENGYDDSDPDVDVTVTITVVPVGSYAYFLVETEIHSTIDPTIVQLIYHDDLTVAAKSVVKVWPQVPAGFGYAMFSLAEHMCDALYFHGNANTEIIGTGIHSNSNCDESVSFEGHAVGIIGGDISTPGGIHVQGAASFTADSTDEDAPVLAMPPLPLPSCAGLDTDPDTYMDGGVEHYQPGIYSGGIILVGMAQWVLDPGLYCMDGDLQINNGVLEGYGIMFYMRGSSGIHITGGDITLTAPRDNELIDGAGEYWNGMLIYYAPTNTSDLVLNGNAGSYFEGTIYNPSGECQVNGSGATAAVDIQVICYNIDLIGAADLVINYNSSNHYVPPVDLDLME